MPKKNNYIFLIIYLIIFQLPATAQKILYPGAPKIFHYSRDDYNANQQNWDFIQDDRGYLYIANTEGLLIYDGKIWQLLPLPNTNIVRTLTKDDKGRIYIAGYDNIGYLANDSLGNIKFVNFDFVKKHHLENIWNLKYLQPDKLIFTTSDSIYTYNLITKELKSLARQTYMILTKINRQLYFYYRHIYTLDTVHNKLTISKLDSVIPNNTPQRLINTLISLGHDNILIFTLDSIYLINKKNYQILKKRKADQYRIIDAATSDSLFAYVNYQRNGIYVYDRNLNLVNVFDKKTGLSANSFFVLFIDQYKNLWTGGENGIDYVILNSPLSYLDKRFDFEMTRRSFHLRDRFYFMTTHIIKYIPDSILFNPTVTYKKSYEIPQTQGQNWDALDLGHFYAIAHNTGIIIISPDSTFSIEPLNNINIWQINKIPGTNYIFIGTNQGAYTAKYNDKTLYDFQKVADGNFRYFAIDKNQTFWGSIISDTAIYIKAKLVDNYSKFDTLEIFGKQQGVTDPYNTYTIYDSIHNRIILDENYTIKFYDTIKNKFLELKDITKHFPEKGRELYLAYVDKYGNYWVNYVNTKLPTGLKFRIYLFQYRKNRLVFSPYLTASAIRRDYALSGYTFNNHFVFLNSTKGPVIFDYLHPVDLTRQRFPIFIRKIISAKDNSLIWGGFQTDSNGRFIAKAAPRLKLDFKHNGIIFYFAAPFFENPDLIQYSYKLEGLDDSWSPWTKANYKEYPFLHEGKYTLRVKAKNIYGVESPELTYHFQVAPPWYRSTAAYIGYFILLLSLIIISIRLYTYNLRRRNERLEQIIKERTREIEMKNIELEQQKEEIQAQAEELADINQELEKLSLIAEKTDNAVLLTDKDGNFIWVNPGFTRIFGYTLEELKLQVSPNIIGEKTDPRIKKIINKCKEKKTTVEYETRFRTKDGRLIWVHTTLTPVLDEDGNVVNLIAIDSDITKLKEAEEKIKIQNENIKGSIRYAQAIQKSILPLKEEFERFFETFILYLPRDIVSGDFYWISNLFHNTNVNTNCQAQHPYFKPGDYLFVSVIDCTGHGVPGAFMSIIGNRMLDNFINQNQIHNPAEVFNKMDETLANIFKHTQESHRDGMAGTLCRFDKICADDQPRIKVTFAGAKTNILVYQHKKNKLTLLRGIRRSIGQKIYKAIDFENQTFYLSQGDIIFLYTDGYKDQNNQERQRFGTKRFQKVIQENIHLPMDQLKEKLEQALQEWMQNTEQRDDITVIGLKIIQL